MAIKSSVANSDQSTFDHMFSGWSVWIEVESTRALLHQMDYLRQVTGGEAVGVNKFLPHLTLLYNIEPLDSDQHAKELLKCCRDQFLANRYHEEQPSISGDASLELVPKEWLTFDYPKSADSGKGFGAAISLMIIQKNKALASLHRVVKEAFPQDERKRDFHPHMSLVYAPQRCIHFLQKCTAQLQHDQFMLESRLKAKALAVWSTAGKTKDWYRIASIPL